MVSVYKSIFFDVLFNRFLSFKVIHAISPYAVNTIAVLTISAVMKPGHAQMTITIINIAQRIIPIIAVS